MKILLFTGIVLIASINYSCHVITIDTLSVSWVEHMGTEYKPSLVIVLGVKKDSSQPVFGLIKEILYISNQCYLAVGLLQVVDYNPHFHAYEVSTQADTMLYSFEDLHDYHPLFMYQPYNCFSTFVSLKYFLV